jgi:hypothetical protein
LICSHGRERAEGREGRREGKEGGRERREGGRGREGREGGWREGRETVSSDSRSSSCSTTMSSPAPPPPPLSQTHPISPRAWAVDHAGPSRAEPLRPVLQGAFAPLARCPLLVDVIGAWLRVARVWLWLEAHRR